MKTVNFMDIDFVDSDLSEVTKVVFDFLAQNDCEQKYIVTPNPEMIVECSKNKYFLNVLRNAWMCFPDGYGIVFYSKFLSGKKIKHRITGVDFVNKFLHKNPDSNVFLLGGAYGAAKKVKKMFPCVTDYYDGVINDSADEYIINKIIQSGATVLLVALGAPKQEVWIARNLEAIPTVKLAIGVGGSLDFIAGIQKRASIGFRKLGMEWLWRVIKEPKRIIRIFRATVVFSVLVLKRRFTSLFS